MATVLGDLSRPEGNGLQAPEALALLFEWRAAELRKAQGKFRRLGVHDLEQIYDETVEALLARPAHEHEQHLQRALRIGIRLRALMALRDRAIHRRVVDEAAPGIQAEGEDRAWSAQPERAVLAREDDFIIGEFIAELTLDERRAFALSAQGKSWRAIATALGISENQARSITRSVEGKRERFVRLFQSGRLCGCRSRTIDEVLAGEQTGELAWRRALAHLRHCRECRCEHQVTFAQLRARFDREALALLPIPAVSLDHLNRVDRVLAVLERPVRLFERLSLGGAARERVIETAAAAGVGAKIAVSVAGIVAVVATGVAVGVHEISPGHPKRHVSAPVTLSSPARSTALASPLGGAPMHSFVWNASKSDSASRSAPGQLVGSSGAPGALVGERRSPGHLLNDGRNSSPQSSDRRGPGTLVSGPTPSGGSDAQDQAARSASYEPSPGSKPPSPAGSAPAAPGQLVHASSGQTSGQKGPGSLLGG